MDFNPYCRIELERLLYNEDTTSGVAKSQPDSVAISRESSAKSPSSMARASSQSLLDDATKLLSGLDIAYSQSDAVGITKSTTKSSLHQLPKSSSPQSLEDATKLLSGLDIAASQLEKIEITKSQSQSVAKVSSQSLLDDSTKLLSGLDIAASQSVEVAVISLDDTTKLLNNLNIVSPHFGVSLEKTESPQHVANSPSPSSNVAYPPSSPESQLSNVANPPSSPSTSSNATNPKSPKSQSPQLISSLVIKVPQSVGDNIDNFHLKSQYLDDLVLNAPLTPSPQLRSHTPRLSLQETVVAVTPPHQLKKLLSFPDASTRSPTPEILTSYQSSSDVDTTQPIQMHYPVGPLATFHVTYDYIHTNVHIHSTFTSKSTQLPMTSYSSIRSSQSQSLSLSPSSQSPSYKRQITTRQIPLIRQQLLQEKMGLHCRKEKEVQAHVVNEEKVATVFYNGAIQGRIKRGLRYHQTKFMGQDEYYQKQRQEQVPEKTIFEFIINWMAMLLIMLLTCYIIFCGISCMENIVDDMWCAYHNYGAMHYLHSITSNFIDKRFAPNIWIGILIGFGLLLTRLLQDLVHLNQRRKLG
ncbi:hypothetical protein RFI_03909 [Reticulomyxa filosa]|uniref:Uncharacterized protein n=1 Tax=Reticulomyxa filosa TaxID=46433 RepID=X6P500_RETFI|nr:hypothetical protein RFI_03909 [Reticulomyxa filosa]|eukprot:ETO33198.1 hypothetical protein RFI_03909 [Reticulomyxa filosa]